MHFGDSIQAPRKPQSLDDLSRGSDRGAELLCPYASELTPPHTPPLHQPKSVEVASPHMRTFQNRYISANWRYGKLDESSSLREDSTHRPLEKSLWSH